jgi:hypothetical protein
MRQADCPALKNAGLREQKAMIALTTIQAWWRVRFSGIGLFSPGL